MPYSPLASYYAMFITHNTTTGEAANADFTPSCYGYKNGVYDNTFSLTTSLAGASGVYKTSGTIPSGTTLNKYDILAEAYFDGKRDVWIADSFLVGPDEANTIQINGSSVEEFTDGATLENQTIMINHLTQIKGPGFDSNTDSLEKLHDQIQYGYTYSGGGGSGTATIENQNTMLSYLNAIKGSTFDQNTDALDAISTKIDGVGTGSATIENQELMIGKLSAIQGPTFDPNTDALEKLSTQIQAGYAYNATLANDAITASKFDETTAFPITSIDSGDTTIARKGSGTHTLTTLNTAIDTVPTAAEIISAWLTETPTAGNTATIKDILLTVYSMARGKLVKNGTVFTFYDDDNATVLFTINITPEQRTPQ